MIDYIRRFEVWILRPLHILLTALGQSGMRKSWAFIGSDLRSIFVGISRMELVLRSDYRVSGNVVRGSFTEGFIQTEIMARFHLFPVPLNHYPIRCRFIPVSSYPGDMNDRIVLEASIHHGKPVIKGTRVPVATIIGALAGGMSRQDVAYEYDVQVVDIEAALSYAAELVDSERAIALAK